MKMAIKRLLVVLIGITLQILLSLIILLYLGKEVAIIQIIYNLLAFIIVINIIKNNTSLSFRLPWIIIILLFPLIGSLLYIIIGNNIYTSSSIRRIIKNTNASKKYLVQDEKIKEEINKKNYDQLNYISSYAGFPVTKNNEFKYFALGDDAYKPILRELKKAEKFIFLEFFIISEGEFWNNVLTILKDKARRGVDVRVMYDDMGCLGFLPPDYKEELEEYGIKFVVFNKLSPFSNLFMNNRNHRKILVIDGKIAISGGFNLADEYVNFITRFGHWKDNVFFVKGEAVWNYTVMFLNLWNSYKKEDKDYKVFKYSPKKKLKVNGYAAPYSSSPLDNEIVGENIYLNIINQAKKYLYITTPYLIIDSELMNALLLAAKRGVDVRIIVPGIPDKKIAYALTQSYFEQLIKGGVKIYKYSKGFIHSKIFVCDDTISTIGTVNLDYRSLYLHFECGLYMYNTNIIKDVKKDVLTTIERSEKVTKKQANPGIIKGIWQSILRLIAPLM